MLLIDSKASKKRGTISGGIKKCCLEYRFLIDSGYAASPFKSIRFNSLPQLLCTICIAIQEFLILKVSFKDDVDHRKSKGSIRSRFQLQPDISFCSGFAKEWINHNKRSSALPCLHDITASPASPCNGRIDSPAYKAISIRYIICLRIVQSSAECDIDIYQSRPETLSPAGSTMVRKAKDVCKPRIAA